MSGAFLNRKHIAITRRIRWIAFGLFVLTLAGCGSTQATKEVKIGEPAGNSKLEMTVNSVKALREITMEDGSVSTVSRSGVYLLLDLTVKNLQQDVQDIDLHDMQLRVGQKYWRPLESFADDPHVPKAFRPLRTELRPGKKAHGMILFRIPRGTLMSLTYSADSKDIVIGLEGIKAKPAAAKPVPRLSQTARAGGLSMIVRSVTYPRKLVYSKPGSGVTLTLSARANQKLVVIDIVLKNIKRKPAYGIDPLAVAIIDAKGTGWLPYNRKQVALPESVQLPVKRLKPGAQVRGKVVISFPASRQLKRIRYGVGVLGPPLEVRITK